MKRLTTLALLSVLLGVFSIQSAFAGPFGIDMGMSLDKVKQVCKTTPKRIENDLYEIIPPKTNGLFARYIVRIDPTYGIYWMKAIGKNIYTNGYGDALRSTFDNLVESIRKTYGEESYKNDSLKEGSIWGDSKYFMLSLQQEDRTLYAIWSKQIDLMTELLNDPKITSATETERQNILSDTTAMQNLLLDKISKYQKLPSDIATIGVFANALSTTIGCVTLEYSFSNEAAVQAKADSVF